MMTTAARISASFSPAATSVVSTVGRDTWREENSLAAKPVVGEVMGQVRSGHLSKGRRMWSFLGAAPVPRVWGRAGGGLGSSVPNRPGSASLAATRHWDRVSGEQRRSLDMDPLQWRWRYWPGDEGGTSPSIKGGSLLGGPPPPTRVIRGGPGSDRLYGGPGNDPILRRAGQRSDRRPPGRHDRVPGIGNELGRRCRWPGRRSGGGQARAVQPHRGRPGRSDLAQLPGQGVDDPLRARPVASEQPRRRREQSSSQ